MNDSTTEYLDKVHDMAMEYLVEFTREHGGHPDDIDTSDIDQEELAFFKLSEAFVFVYHPTSEVN